MPLRKLTVMAGDALQHSHATCELPNVCTCVSCLYIAVKVGAGASVSAVSQSHMHGTSAQKHLDAVHRLHMTLDCVQPAHPVAVPVLAWPECQDFA